MLRNRDLVPAPKKKKSPTKFIFLAVLGLLSAIPARFVVHSFWVFPLEIQTNYMAPEVPQNSTVYINRQVEYKDLKSGDLVLLKHPQSPDLHLLRRVVGIAGQHIQLKNGQVFRNRKLLKNQGPLKHKPPFLPAKISRRDNTYGELIKEGFLFVMADNRKAGLDSRQLGQLNSTLVVGRVWK